jgi:integrase
MAIGFTDKGIKALKADGKECWLREGQGFAIRVYPSGEKGWYFIYTFEGRKRFMKLGTYPDVSLSKAREKHGDARKKLTNGVDPLTEQEQAKEARRSAHTVTELVEEYIDKHAKKFKRSWKEDERVLNKEVIPLWGKRKAVDLVKRDIVLLLEKIVDRGSPGMSNNTFQVVRKMMNFAVERDILPYSPAAGVKALAPKNNRDRTLSVAEIKTLWGSLGDSAISYYIQQALRLILVTAQRPGEAIGLHTREIDGDWWTVPAERAKNGKAHRVYLTATAKEIIQQTIDHYKKQQKIPADVEYEGFVFPCPHIKKVKGIDPHAVAIAVHRNLAWPVIDTNKKPMLDDGKQIFENKLQVDHFTPHDLRRTAATFMSEMGFMDEVIDAVLSHAKQGIIKVYNLNKYDNEKQQALETWERKLNSIIGGKESGKVIPIGSKKVA